MFSIQMTNVSTLLDSQENKVLRLIHSWIKIGFFFSFFCLTVYCQSQYLRLNTLKGRKVKTRNKTKTKTITKDVKVGVYCVR